MKNPNSILLTVRFTTELTQMQSLQAVSYFQMKMEMSKKWTKESEDVYSSAKWKEIVSKSEASCQRTSLSCLTTIWASSSTTISALERWYSRTLARTWVAFGLNSLKIMTTRMRSAPWVQPNLIRLATPFTKIRTALPRFTTMPIAGISTVSSIAQFQSMMILMPTLT